MKTVIWFIGSNSSGKTTQCRMLHEHISGFNKKIHKGVTENEVEWVYTTFGKTSHVGAVNDNQCTGTDTLPLKVNVEASYLKCLMDSKSDYVLLDPIMSTFQYVEMLRQFPIKLYLVYLHFETAEENFDRVIKRREQKTQKFGEIVLSDKTKENISRKQQNFYNLYNKAKHECDKHILVNANDKPRKIHKQIRKLLNNEE